MLDLKSKIFDFSDRAGLSLSVGVAARLAGWTRRKYVHILEHCVFPPSEKERPQSFGQVKDVVSYIFNFFFGVGRSSPHG